MLAYLGDVAGTKEESEGCALLSGGPDDLGGPEHDVLVGDICGGVLARNDVPRGMLEQGTDDGNVNKGSLQNDYRI